MTTTDRLAPLVAGVLIAALMAATFLFGAREFMAAVDSFVGNL